MLKQSVTQCLSKRCSCRKNGSKCTSLCDCLNCENADQVISRNEGNYEPLGIIEEEDISESEVVSEEEGADSAAELSETDDFDM